MQDFSLFPQVFLLAAVGSVLGLVGGLVFLSIKPWSKWLGKYSVPFAAGVLLTVSLVGILPEISEILGEQGFNLVLFAFLASYLFENFVTSLHHHDEDHGHPVTKSIPLVIFGDTLHNFIDGVAIAAAFLVHPGLGVVTAISTFLHEVPHEIGDFGILLKAGWSKLKIIVVNLLSSLATFLGAAMVLLMSFGEEQVAPLLAVAAGMFLYLGASDFLPSIKTGEEKRQPFMPVVALLLGCIAMIIVFELVPHSH